MTQRRRRTTEYTALVLALILALSLTGCGEKEPESYPEDYGIAAAAEEGEYVKFGEPEAPHVEAEPDEYYLRYENTELMPEDGAEDEEPLCPGAGTEVRVTERIGDRWTVEYEGRLYSCFALSLAAKDTDQYCEERLETLKAMAFSPTFVPVEPVECATIASVLNCRNEANLDSDVLFQAFYGTRVTVYGYDNSFCLCELSRTDGCINGGFVYCWKDYIYGAQEPYMPEYAVELETYLPDAKFNLLFCSSDNVAGRPLYPAKPLLENTTAGMLKEAYDRFSADGYTMVICDAYRPASAQETLFEIVGDFRFIADPSMGWSWHQYGRAVDMTLWDNAAGKEFEMPTPMHTFSMASSRTHKYEWTEEAKKNVEYMTEVMTDAGFSTIDTEWWHFEYTGKGNWLPRELDLSAISHISMEEWLEMIS